MEKKTTIDAAPGRHDLTITRDFDLPVTLLFTAYEQPELVEQWMGTQVLKLESRKHGSYQFETTDPKGNKHSFSGVIHAFVPNHQITRTFEMENTPYGVQLECYRFEALTETSSRLTMHVVYESIDQRDAVLKLPFAQGINMAHNRIQDILIKSIS